MSRTVTNKTAMVIVEPIQGESGVITPPAGYLKALREICDDKGALLVIDAVQTGMGRTGFWFGYEHEEITPDVITVAKGFGGGLPLGAMIAIGPAAHLLQPGEHGSTFGGNPVSCAAGLAAINEVEKKSLNEKALELGEFLKSELLKIDGVAEVRGRGLLLGIALEQNWAKEIANFLLAKGVLVNAPNENTIRIAPPLIITKQECQKFVKIFAEVIANG
jgi:acetylornithine aminotransferase